MPNVCTVWGPPCYIFFLPCPLCRQQNEALRKLVHRVNDVSKNKFHTELSLRNIRCDAAFLTFCISGTTDTLMLFISELAVDGYMPCIDLASLRYSGKSKGF